MKLLCFLLFCFGLQLQVVQAASPLRVDAIDPATAAFFAAEKHHHPQTNQTQILNSSKLKSLSASVSGKLELQDRVFFDAPNTVTFFFTDLEDLLNGLMKIQKSKKQQIDLLNLISHGKPGTLLFPKSGQARLSAECADFRSSASNAELGYEQYYGLPDSAYLQEMNQMSHNLGHVGEACSVEVEDFQIAFKKVVGMSQLFTSNAQINVLSCVAGLGPRGQKFSKNLASLLLSHSSSGRLITQIEYGTADWSLPNDSAGFWNYKNDHQLSIDVASYASQQMDSKITQPGRVLITQFQPASKNWTQSISSVMQYLKLDQKLKAN